MLFKLCFPKNMDYLPNLHINRYLGPSFILIISSFVISSIWAVSMTLLLKNDLTARNEGALC